MTIQEPHFQSLSEPEFHQLQFHFTWEDWLSPTHCQIVIVICSAALQLTL